MKWQPEAVTAEFPLDPETGVMLFGRSYVDQFTAQFMAAARAYAHAHLTVRGTADPEPGDIIDPCKGAVGQTVPYRLDHVVEYAAVHMRYLNHSGAAALLLPEWTQGYLDMYRMRQRVREVQLVVLPAWQTPEEHPTAWHALGVTQPGPGLVDLFLPDRWSSLTYLWCAKPPVPVPEHETAAQ